MEVWASYIYHHYDKSEILFWHFMHNNLAESFSWSRTSNLSLESYKKRGNLATVSFDSQLISQSTRSRDSCC